VVQSLDRHVPSIAEDKIEIFYEGVPVVSRNPPEYISRFRLIDSTQTNSLRYNGAS
jgi:hypothetical protein